MDKMIVYEDKALLVVHKPAGIATETARVGQADLVSELKNYRQRKGEEPYIGVVHRLDQPVEGLWSLQRTPGQHMRLAAACKRAVWQKNMQRSWQGFQTRRRARSRTVC